MACWTCCGRWPVALVLAWLLATGLMIHRLGWRRPMPVMGAAHRLLTSDADAPWFKSGDTLALQFAPGRFSGLFVTGWQALPPGQP